MNRWEGRCRCGTCNCAMSRSEHDPPAAPDYTGDGRRLRSALLRRFPHRRRFPSRLRARTCRPALCLRVAACSGRSLSAASIRLASGHSAGGEIKLPLQRSDHAAKRLRGAKQQRLVAGPVARGVCGECFPRHSISSRGPGALPPEIEQAAGHSRSLSFRASASAESRRRNSLKVLKKSVKRIRPNKDGPVGSALHQLGKIVRIVRIVRIIRIIRIVRIVRLVPSFKVPLVGWPARR